MFQENQDNLIVKNNEVEPEKGKLLCFLDPRLNGDGEKLEKVLMRLFSSIDMVKGNFGSARFFQRIKEIEKSDTGIFLFFLKVTNYQQINELYGIWRKLKQKEINSVFVIFNYREVFNKRDESVINRRSEMRSDPKNKLVYFSEVAADANAFKLMIEKLRST